ncbi:MAG: vWA domain-containing protein [Burkholderiaceae bacterium]
MIAENVAHFARVLRSAGLAVGPDRVVAAVAALECVGVERRGDVHAALSAVMLDRHDQQPLFDAAFDAFWRDPKLLEKLLMELLPKISGRGTRPQAPRPNRLAQALAPERDRPGTSANPSASEEIRFDASFTFSDRERLQRADFDTMTPEEFKLASRLAEDLPPPVAPVRRRRHERAPRGVPDLRATLRAMVRAPHTLVPLTTRPRRELPPLVVLLDVSGSMDRYARVMLHYVHGLARRHPRIHAFTFGTRLTDVTRCLRGRDPDVALAAIGQRAGDWHGGTRIASCLAEFNRHWARRVLGANAAVLLVTDGLDRDEHGSLADEAARLRRGAHELVWLNPLLRFDGFEPRAAGVRALLPHVDRFLPVHNLASLADLRRALQAAASPRPSSRPWN